jgi:hypothetical protein
MGEATSTSSRLKLRPAALTTSAFTSDSPL